MSLNWRMKKKERKEEEVGGGGGGGGGTSKKRKWRDLGVTVLFAKEKTNSLILSAYSLVRKLAASAVSRPNRVRKKMLLSARRNKISSTSTLTRAHISKQITVILIWG